MFQIHVFKDILKLHILNINIIIALYLPSEILKQEINALSKRSSSYRNMIKQNKNTRNL